MSALTLQTKNRCFNGEQRYYSHRSSVTNTEMSFSIYLPDEALVGKTCPAILYLSGLTCSPDNVTHKAHFQQKCSELGMIFVAPDTSPKGENVANDDRYFVGQGASYYVDATEQPWAENFKMHSYIAEEFYDLIRSQFAISSVGITGHSMGGHGAIMFGFKYPSKFISVSAIAPVCVASESDWGKTAFGEYFGQANDQQQAWSQFDAVTVVEKAGKQYPLILVDQGAAEDFYIEIKSTYTFKICRKTNQFKKIKWVNDNIKKVKIKIIQENVVENYLKKHYH